MSRSQALRTRTTREQPWMSYDTLGSTYVLHPLSLASRHDTFSPSSTRLDSTRLEPELELELGLGLELEARRRGWLRPLQPPSNVRLNRNWQRVDKVCHDNVVRFGRATVSIAVLAVVAVAWWWRRWWCSSFKDRCKSSAQLAEEEQGPTGRVAPWSRSRPMRLSFAYLRTHGSQRR